jgi:hypothetical protein
MDGHILTSLNDDDDDDEEAKDTLTAGEGRAKEMQNRHRLARIFWRVFSVQSA